MCVQRGAMSNQEKREMEMVERKHQMDMKALYKGLQAVTSAKERKMIRKRIDQAVEEHNYWHPKGHNYYDLHWMSVWGAMDYVARIVKKTSRKNEKVFRHFHS